MYLQLHADLYNLICDYLDFIDKIHHLIVCKQFKFIKICDMYNIDSKYLKCLNDEILKNYRDLEKLNARNNSKITTLNYMKKLKILDISDFCDVNDQGIQDLNLEELNASCNSKITTLRHMTKLKKLDISGN